MFTGAMKKSPEALVVIRKRGGGESIEGAL